MINFYCSILIIVLILIVILSICALLAHLFYQQIEMKEKIEKFEKMLQHQRSVCYEFELESKASVKSALNELMSMLYLYRSRIENELLEESFLCLVSVFEKKLFEDLKKESFTLFQLANALTVCSLSLTDKMKSNTIIPELVLNKRIVQIKFTNDVFDISIFFRIDDDGVLVFESPNNKALLWVCSAKSDIASNFGRPCKLNQGSEQQVLY